MFKSNAQELSFDKEFIVNPGDTDYVNPKLTNHQKYYEHREHAICYFEMAEDISWYLPKYDDRDMAKLCFSTSVSLYSCPGTTAKIIAASLNVFLDYGFHMIDEYQKVNHYLHRSNYHADLMEFFYDLRQKELEEQERKEFEEELNVSFDRYVVNDYYVDENGEVKHINQHSMDFL